MTRVIRLMRYLLFVRPSTQNLTYLSGPISNTFDAVHPLIDQAKIVDFGTIPSSQYDTLSDPYVFRQVVSNSVLGTAMAFYAINRVGPSAR